MAYYIIDDVQSYNGLPLHGFDYYESCLNNLRVCIKHEYKPYYIAQLGIISYLSSVDIISLCYDICCNGKTICEIDLHFDIVLPHHGPSRIHEIQTMTDEIINLHSRGAGIRHYYGRLETDANKLGMP